METEETLLQADISGSEDEGDDERKHNQLVDAISSLDGKNRHKLSQRTVPTNQVSEFNFATSGEGASKVRLHELIGSLKDTAKLGNLKRQLNIVDKRKKVVSTPLPKHEKQKIDRSIAYESTKQDISKWDTVVSKNRLAEQLQFPLQKPDFKLATIDDYVKRSELRTPLEVQVAALLKGSDYVIKDQKQELTPAEQRALKAMDIQEARERHAELMKHKALLSYQEAKARWRNKIKSKRYHRMLKKTRLKQERKALDDLEKNDPEGYREKLRQLDKDRIQERMSLKHRGGSKYAKKQMIYAKYDNKARDEVQDMLQRSRDLTKKLENNSDSEESEGGITPDEEEDVMSLDRGDNPWMTRVRPAKKDNPWMAKPEMIDNKSEFARPEAYQSGMTEGENDSDAEVENVSDDITSHDDFKGSKSDELGSGSENEEDSNIVDAAELTTEMNGSDLNSDDSDVGKNDTDEIDEIFSSASKKTNLSKSDSKESKKMGKKKRKKEKNLTEKGENVNNGKEKKGALTTKSGSKKKKTDIDSFNDDEIENDNDEDDTALISEGLNRKRTLEEIEYSESDGEVEETKKVKNVSKKEEGKKNAGKEVFVDPKKLFTLDSKLKQVGSGPDLVDLDDDDLDPEEQQRMTIAQAFADDDVIEEFQRDKVADIDRNKPKDIDLTLPGWGDWGGAGIKVNKRKRKRFIIKAPPAAPRRDLHLGNVIINEQKTQAVTKHQVNELPYPFVNSEQFEKSIRAPLGKTWNTETAYRELVKPKVVTRLGKIITPMDKSEVYKNVNKKSDFSESCKNKESGKEKDGGRRSNYNRGDSRKKHVKDKNPGKKKISK